MKYKLAFDNGGKTIDRYTIIFDNWDTFFLSDNANMPNGACIYCKEINEFDFNNSDLGRQIYFRDLPKGTQKQIEYLEKEYK